MLTFEAWVCDYFHEFRGLFNLLHRWERKAYAALRKKYEAAEKFDQAKSESHRERTSKNCAEGYTHIQNTFSQQANFNICSEEVRKKTTRRDIPGRLDDPDLSMTLDCDLDLIDTLDAIIYKVEKQVLAQAKHHDRKALSILMTVPGVGKMLALTILYEIHTIDRFKSASHLSSSCRLAKVERTSVGKKTGDGNQKIGN